MTDQTPLSSRTLGIVLVVALTQFLQMLDASVIAIALPPMARDFGVSPVSVGFGITVYVLAASIVIPASAWLADRIGGRTLLTLSVGGFTAASLLCGLSHELWQFIGARALQGVFGALMAPVSQIILLRSVERTELLRVMNLTSIPMLAAPVLGPPLGGMLATWFGWEWIFYINLPVGLVVIALALRLLPDPKGEPRPFDRTGLALNALALTPLLWGLGELGGHGAGRAGPIAAVAAGVVVGAFALRHAWRADHPLVSLAPIRHPTFRLTAGSSMALILIPVTAQAFILPILLQTGLGMTAFLAGVLFLGHTAADLLMKIFTPRTFRRFGYRRVMLAATVVMTVAIAAAALINRSTALAGIAGVLFVSGGARSFLMGGQMSLAYADVDEAEMPSAATLTQVMLQLATALGVSLTSLVVDLAPRMAGVSGDEATMFGARSALVLTALVGMTGMAFLLRLPKNAGAVLSGHKAPHMETV